MDYVITNGELYHHGIKGMKWGVRRFQNKDGSLTPRGKKRLAEGLKKDFNKDFYKARTSKDVVDAVQKYERNVSDAANKGLTVEDKKQVVDAKNKLIDAVGNAKDAETELYDLADEYTIEYYNAKVDENPDKYIDPSASYNLMIYADNYGYDKAQQLRPDLVKAIAEKDACAEAYVKVCKDASEKLLGEYGDTKLYDLDAASPTVKESIVNIIAGMDFDLSEGKNRKRK